MFPGVWRVCVHVCVCLHTSPSRAGLRFPAQRISHTELTELGRRKFTRSRRICQSISFHLFMRNCFPFKS